MHKRRRILGTYLGVGFAAALLPGISPVAGNPFWQVMLAGIGFLIVNQLIHSYPSAIRTAPPVMLLILAAVGIVQDTLVWLLVSWLSGQTGAGLHVDGFLPALLGGVITRATVLAALALGPQPEPAQETRKGPHDRSRTGPFRSSMSYQAFKPTRITC